LDLALEADEAGRRRVLRDVVERLQLDLGAKLPVLDAAPDEGGQRHAVPHAAHVDTDAGLRLRLAGEDAADVGAHRAGPSPESCPASPPIASRSARARARISSTIGLFASW